MYKSPTTIYSSMVSPDVLRSWSCALGLMALIQKTAVIRAEVNQCWCFLVSQGYVGSIPAQPDWSREGNQEKMFRICPVPGGCYRWVSRLDQRRCCEGRIISPSVEGYSSFHHLG